MKFYSSTLIWFIFPLDSSASPYFSFTFFHQKQVTYANENLTIDWHWQQFFRLTTFAMLCATLWSLWQCMAMYFGITVSLFQFWFLSLFIFCFIAFCCSLFRFSPLFWIWRIIPNLIAFGNTSVCIFLCRNIRGLDYKQE